MVPQPLSKVLGLVGIVGSGVLWSTTSETSTFAFSGGFLLASLAAGMVVLCCRGGAALAVGAPLGAPAPAAMGRISYGVYLWYWPVLLVMTGHGCTGASTRFFGRVGVTVAIAAISDQFVEMPIRRGACSIGGPDRRPLVAAAAIGAVLVSTLVPVGARSSRARAGVTARAVDHIDGGARGGDEPARAVPIPVGQTTETSATLPARCRRPRSRRPPGGGPARGVRREADEGVPVR